MEESEEGVHEVQTSIIHDTHQTQFLLKRLLQALKHKMEPPLNMFLEARAGLKKFKDMFSELRRLLGKSTGTGRKSCSFSC